MNKLTQACLEYFKLNVCITVMRSDWDSQCAQQGIICTHHNKLLFHYVAITVETVTNFIFWGSKITAYGDCCHEIKRHLLHGRKVMINLDSILKSRDITLVPKVCLVKAMVFSVVIYGCESWTVKKAEHQINDSFELRCWRRLLRIPWTARRSN